MQQFLIFHQNIALERSRGLAFGCSIGFEHERIIKAIKKYRKDLIDFIAVVLKFKFYNKSKKVNKLQLYNFQSL